MARAGGHMFPLREDHHAEEAACRRSPMPDHAARHRLGLATVDPTGVLLGKRSTAPVSLPVLRFLDAEMPLEKARKRSEPTTTV
jgi:hypothetical protein